MFSLFFAVLIAVVNSWSVKWATRIINVFTYGKLMCIFILIVVGVVHLGRGKGFFFRRKIETLIGSD